MRVPSLSLWVKKRCDSNGREIGGDVDISNNPLFTQPETIDYPKAWDEPPSVPKPKTPAAGVASAENDNANVIPKDGEEVSSDDEENEYYYEELEVEYEEECGEDDAGEDDAGEDEEGEQCDEECGGDDAGEDEEGEQCDEECGEDDAGEADESEGKSQNPSAPKEDNNGVSTTHRAKRMAALKAHGGINEQHVLAEDSKKLLEQMDKEGVRNDKLEASRILQGHINNFTDSSNSQANPNLGCVGCARGECMKTISYFDILRSSSDNVKALLDNHLILWSRPPCCHIGPEGEEIFVLRDEAGKCPYPRCEKVGYELGPVIPHGAYNRSGLPERIAYARLYADGISHDTMMNTLSLKANKNSLTSWRTELETALTAAHFLDTKKALGTALFVQADEFCMGLRKGNRGDATNEHDQMWFQSLVVTDISPKSKTARPRVIGFYVRYVPNRRAETLQKWIIAMCADGAEVFTDSWAAYDGLVETAAKEGKKVITHDMVNHKHMFINSRGAHTNHVEGMHMHLKVFLRKFVRIGQGKVQRIFRTIASAQLSNPVNDTGLGRISRFQRLMMSLRTVAMYGVPSEVIALDGVVNTFAGDFPVLMRCPTTFKFINVSDGIPYVLKKERLTVKKMNSALQAYEASQKRDEPAKEEQKKSKKLAKAARKAEAAATQLAKLVKQRRKLEDRISAAEKTAAIRMREANGEPSKESPKRRLL